MRSFIAAVAALLSLLLLAAAVPAVWADRSLVNEDGFAALAGPLGSEAEFQSALSASTAKAVASQLQLGAGMSSLVEPLIEQATSGLGKDPGYPAAWTETLRRSHRLTLAATPAPGTEQGLTLDVAPMLALVTAKVSAAVGVTMAAPPKVLISLGQPAQRKAISTVATYAPWGSWLAAAAGVLLVLAVVSARRRSTTLAVYGAGLLLVCAGWKLALDAVAGAVRKAPAANEVAGLFKDRLIGAASDSFSSWILVALIIGAVLLAVGLLGRLVARRPNQPLA